MEGFDYHNIDDVLHSRIRTAVMAVLITVEEAEFTFIRDKIKATDGNLSVHIRKLEDSGYVNVIKKFVDRKPMSVYNLTEKGREAFNDYIKKLESLIRK